MVLLMFQVLLVLLHCLTSVGVLQSTIVLDTDSYCLLQKKGANAAKLPKLTLAPLEGCRLHFESKNFGAIDACTGDHGEVRRVLGEGLCPREKLHSVMEDMEFDDTAEPSVLLAKHDPMTPIWVQWMQAYTPIVRAPTGKGWQTLHERGVYILKNFLSNDEANRAVQATRSTMHMASTIGFGHNAVCTFRRSKHFDRTSSLPADLRERMSSAVGMETSKDEALSMTRYDKGDFYSQHLDENPCDHHESGVKVSSVASIVSKVSSFEMGPKLCERKKRFGTLLIYLTDAIHGGGGATYFPNLNLRVLPEKGTAVFFRPTDSNHEADPAMLHAAEAVLKGSKVVVQQWFDS